MKRILNMNYILRIAIVLAVLPLLSCEHKDLSGTLAADVEVVFDWKNAPSAKPEEMRVYFFPVNGGAYEVYDISNYEGGTIKIPEGTYRALCVNNDTESVLYRGYSSFDNFEAYAIDGTMRSSAPRMESTASERLASSPDRLYSDCLEEEVTIKLGKSGQKITFYPEFTECRYRVTITNVTNLKYVSSSGLFGTLSGVSGGYMLGSREFTTDGVTMCFDPESDGESTITAEFLPFGNAATSLHELVIYVTMSDGNRQYYTFDVTNQVNNASDPRDVHIVLSGLVLPKPIVNGSGFHPSVEDWDEIEIDIPMGSDDKDDSKDNKNE